MEVITWQIAVVILGGITAFLQFLYNMLKQKNKEGDTEKLTVLTVQLEQAKKDLKELREDIKSIDDRHRITIERIEDRIEKIMDTIIDHLKND